MENWNNGPYEGLEWKPFTGNARNAAVGVDRRRPGATGGFCHCRFRIRRACRPDWVLLARHRPIPATHDRALCTASPRPVSCSRASLATSVRIASSMMLFAGGVVLLATLIATFAGSSDESGRLIVIASVVFGIAGALATGWQEVRRIPQTNREESTRQQSNRIGARKLSEPRGQMIERLSQAADGLRSRLMNKRARSSGPETTGDPVSEAGPHRTSGTFDFRPTISILLTERRH